MENELKPFWRNFFKFNWKFGLFLILIICVPRFILVLKANSTGNYNAIGFIMMICTLLPFIFLTKYGLKKIGFCKPEKYNWLLIAFLIGLAASILIYFLGIILYGNTYQNWYHYIGKSYPIPKSISDSQKAIVFAIITFTSCTFSPIGEELFFRGIVHASFANSLGEKKASFIDSLAFAITHISHFGLIFINGKWLFLTIPTIIWMICMFLVSILFHQSKKNSNSILGAIICHAAFNLGMTYCIFYLM